VCTSSCFRGGRMIELAQWEGNQIARSQVYRGNSLACPRGPAVARPSSPPLVWAHCTLSPNRNENPTKKPSTSARGAHCRFPARSCYPSSYSQTRLERDMAGSLKTRRKDASRKPDDPDESECRPRHSLRRNEVVITDVQAEDDHGNADVY
jgi:hypothetical protein